MAVSGGAAARASRVWNHALHDQGILPPRGRPLATGRSLSAGRAAFVLLAVGSVLGLGVGWFWISAAYSSQYNGTNADFSAYGGTGWAFGVVPVIVAGSGYHLLVLVTGLKAYRWVGFVTALLLIGVTVAVYVLSIVPSAIASGGPASYVP